MSDYDVVIICHDSNIILAYFGIFGKFDLITYLHYFYGIFSLPGGSQKCCPGLCEDRICEMRIDLGL